MTTIAKFTDLPTNPAVFALHGGRGSSRYVAYVGSAASLRASVTRLLVKRNVDLTRGKSAVGLNPHLVTSLSWWEDDRFTRKERLDAAEAVAQEVLDPALRTPLNLSVGARRVHYRPKFRREVRTLFKSAATGIMEIPSLADALEAIGKLSERVSKLEDSLGRS